MREKIKAYIQELVERQDLEDGKLEELICEIHGEEISYLQAEAKKVKEKEYGKKIYLRALIEFTNYCRRECRYCGINAYNPKVERYRMTEEEIYETCEKAWNLGFRSFVLQGGEDAYFTKERLADIVRTIRSRYPKVAITLSVGECSRESYAAWKEAGADRFLLRHETVNAKLYRELHPKSCLDTRLECLEDLKELGYQAGAGFMVGLPSYQKKDYVKELRFLKNFAPHMIGIGPFLPQAETELGKESSGSLEDTIVLLAIIRLLLPGVLLPATTALGTVDEDGRLRGFASGANVIMPNVTPAKYRAKYKLYDGKKITGDEAAEGLAESQAMIAKHGYEVEMSRGDSRIKY